MSDSKSKIFNPNTQKIKKVKKITSFQKEKLINSVIQDHISIHQASKMHEINYSSAKYIINLFKKIGSLTPQHQKHGRKSKVYNVLLTVLINKNSGEILLYKQNKLKQQSKFDENKVSQTQCVHLTAKIIQEVIKNSQKNIICQEIRKKKFSICDDLDELQQIIRNQHEQMLDL